MKPPSTDALARLWLSMGSAFNYRWTKPNGELPIDDNGKLTVQAGVWAIGLAGLSDRQIFQGFERCVTGPDAWPPSLPTFKALCYGIPSLAKVREEFRDVDGKNRSPFARKLWQFIDSYAYGRADAEKSERMIRDAYDLTREHVMNGGALDPAPVAAIETERPAPIKPASRETVLKHINDNIETLKKQNYEFNDSQKAEQGGEG